VSNKSLRGPHPGQILPILKNTVKNCKLGKISFFDTHFLGEDDFPFEENGIFNHIDELTLRKHKSESGY
jgi:hypothetical protein